MPTDRHRLAAAGPDERDDGLVRIEWCKTMSIGRSETVGNDPSAEVGESFSVTSEQDCTARQTRGGPHGYEQRVGRCC